MTASRWFLAAAGLAVALTIAWLGAGAIGRQVWQAVWVVPLAIGIHAAQLGLSARAWRVASGAALPPFATWWRVRWIREAVNSTLPVAQLGGNLVGVRLLAKAGLPLAQGGAGVTLDLTVEAAAQALFTLTGVAALAGSDADSVWVRWFGAGAGTLLLAVLGFFALQRLGGLRLVEAAFERLARLLPKQWSNLSLRGLNAELLRLQRNRAALWQCLLLHLTAWLLGCGETWLAMAAMGHPASWRAALVIESLGMAARSAGFVVPGALGLQEAGYILVGGLFGMPPDTSVALSMVKRARELIVGVSGLIAWQWNELRAPEPASGRRAVVADPVPEVQP